MSNMQNKKTKTQSSWQSAEIAQIEKFLKANTAVREFHIKTRGKKMLLIEYSDGHAFTTDLRISRESEHSFFVERFCYRGSIDDWIPLGCVNLAGTNAYIRHLGHLSFYDLG